MKLNIYKRTRDKMNNFLYYILLINISMSYAFVTCIFGKYTYVKGAIILSLALQNQHNKYDTICLIDNNLSKHKNLLEKFYTKVFIVDEISTKSTMYPINKKFFEHGDSLLLTKLHIFRKQLLSYDKIVYIDSDLVPINYFTNLFAYKAPAGWLECKKNGIHTWGYNDFSTSTIPDESTNQLKNTGSEINTGLLVIEPNDYIFDDMMNILCNEPSSKFIGRNVNNNITNGYTPERIDQQFITQYFTGEWRYINPLFNCWGFATQFEPYGVHMAGLFYFVNGKRITDKTWEIQLDNDNNYNVYLNKLIYDYYEQHKDILKDIIKNINIIVHYEGNVYIKNITDVELSHLSKSQKLLQNLVKSEKKFE